MVFNMLRKAKEKAEQVANYSGNKDFLEGVAAGVALVAAASGDISDQEESTAIKVAQQNVALNKAFSDREIEDSFHKMFEKAGTFSGKRSLQREIEDVAGRGNDQQAEDIVTTMLDVAASDGDIDDDEMKVLRKVSESLRVNLDALLG